MDKPNKVTLTLDDFRAGAQKLNVTLAAVKTVTKVEARGAGFNVAGEPKILFERHIFHKLTGGKYSKSHPHISNPKPGGYGTESSQHSRLQEAVKLDRVAALMSASWGMFQIMGFNFALAGFKTVQAFVTAMYKGEAEHLLAFCEYVKNTFLDDELRDRRWDDFARKYNGPDYKKNRYAEKLASAFADYSKRL